MLIFEAKGIIDDRIELIEKDYKDDIPEYLEAFKIASKCIEKQLDLIDLLNDWDIESEAERGDTFSALLCYNMIRQFSIYAEEDEDYVKDDEAAGL